MAKAANVTAEITERLDSLEKELDGKSRQLSGYATDRDIRVLIAVLRAIVPALRRQPHTKKARQK